MIDQPSSMDCAWLLTEPGTVLARANSRVSFSGGRIASIEALSAPVPGPRRLVLPALVNAHDHARTFRSATLGAFEKPLEAWLPYLSVLPGMDPYLCAATSFARSVRHGVTNLMVHYTRVQGVMAYVDEALAVARAARDVGIHIGFAVSMRDRNGIGLCNDSTVLAALSPSLREPVAQRLSVLPVAPALQLAVVEAVAEALAADASLQPHITLQYGPTAVQWCSTPLLQAVASASHDRGRPVHMHLLESRYQREWADQAFPQGIVRYLDEIGLLSPRLTLAHCTWARTDELVLMAERGVTIAVNTSSNLGLKSGVAPLARMVREGCRVAMGLDGMAFDEDDDALHEMRLAYALHRGWGFDNSFSRAQLWAFAAQNGRRSVRGASADAELGGLLSVGTAADLLVLDWEALDDDPLFGDIDPLDLILARGRGVHIREVLAAGRRVVHNGAVTGIDEHALKAELLGRTRTALAAAPAFDVWRRQIGEMAEDLGPFYRRRAWAECC